MGVAMERLDAFGDWLGENRVVVDVEPDAVLAP